MKLIYVSSSGNEVKIYARGIKQCNALCHSLCPNDAKKLADYLMRKIDIFLIARVTAVISDVV
jgi:hypothetical protein